MAEQLPWQEKAERLLAEAGQTPLRISNSITIFFPAYNDANTIGTLIEYSLRALSPVCDDFEIVVVNDGSIDNTEAVLRDWESKDPHVKVVTHPQNRGYGGALISGFSHATKELVFYTDGDGQYDPTEIITMIPQINDCDVVQGYKIVRRDAWYRTVIGRIYHHVAQAAFRLQIRDVDCDFRLVRRSVFDRIELECNYGFICTEMMKKIQDAGFRIIEVPVHHYPRVFGHSMFFTPRRLLRIIPTFAKFWWRLVGLKIGRRALQRAQRYLPARRMKESFDKPTGVEVTG